MPREDFVTISYQVHEGKEQPDRFAMPQIGILETLRVNFVDGQWEVTSTETDASPNWIGRSESRQGAILNYLKTRLGVYENW